MFEAPGETRSSGELTTSSRLAEKFRYLRRLRGALAERAYVDHSPSASGALPVMLPVRYSVRIDEVDAK